MSEISEIPHGWGWATIPEMIPKDGVFIDGDWIESKDQDPNGGVRLIQLADIGDGNFRNKSSRFLTLKRADDLNCTFLRLNDILVARMPDPIGRACLFPLKNEKSFVTAVDVAIIRLGENGVNPKFLMHFINSLHIRREIENLQSGTTRKRISRSNLAIIKFPLPPLPEQHRIVAKIEELFSSLDKGIENLKTAQQQLKVYRQAVLKWAFEGKLTHENVVEGELPEGWKWVNLEETGKLVSGYAFKSSDFTDEGIPVIKISNIGYSEFFWKEQQYLPNEFVTVFKNFIVEYGDILIALTRPITNNTTKVCKFPLKDGKALLNQRVACIKEFHSGVHKEYVFLFFQTNYFKSYIRSKFSETLQPNLSPKDLVLCPIPLPTISEQQRIVAEIESRLSVCDKIEEGIEYILRQVESLRQSILKKAFEGKLVPQDPSDEAASKLLERIRAERDKQAAEQRHVNRKTKIINPNSCVAAAC